MTDDYLRLISAQLHSLLQIHTAREMFGKSIFALGTGEVTAVGNAVTNLENANSVWLNIDFVRQLATTTGEAQKPQSRQMGFAVPDKKD